MGNCSIKIYSNPSHHLVCINPLAIDETYCVQVILSNLQTFLSKKL